MSNKKQFSVLLNKLVRENIILYGEKSQNHKQEI